ncbi:MAG: response regulator transcription factor [Syntrophobacteraceae bacterium]|nr:response regulator transcription factor [Syntrophobacteraceae bacterium]
MVSVLIVEDNDFFRRSFKEILRMYIPSLSVAESSDGSDVFAQMSRTLPDMIFMDMRLPGKSGLELSREIKARYPEVAISIFTSYDYPEYRKIAKECGADHYLLKDALTGAEIAAMVKEQVNAKQKKMGKSERKKGLRQTTKERPDQEGRRT